MHSLTDPEHIPLGMHIWMTASAGSGKTKRLTDRLLQLLLEGARFSELVCVSFTTVAAQEIIARLHQRILDLGSADSETRTQLLKPIVGDVTPRHLQRCVFLVNNLWEEGHRLITGTIHSLCQRIVTHGAYAVLGGAPFTVMDEPQSLFLWKKSVVDVLKDASAPVTEALNVLTQIVHEMRFSTLVESLYPVRHSLKKNSLVNFVDRQHSRAALFEDADFSQGIVWARAAGLASLEKALQKAQERPHERGKILQPFLVTTLGQPRQRLLTAESAKQFPQLLQLLEHFQATYIAHENHVQEQEAACWQRAWEALGSAVNARYSQLKKHQGLMDYDDLLYQACDLLEKEGGRLLFDVGLGGVRALLVDEAQDTSSLQWRVLHLLWNLWSENDPSNPPLLFVVGDPKQTIFGFQGSSTKTFMQMKQSFVHHPAGCWPWREVYLTRSYRSVPSVLKFVDAFAQQPSVGVLLTGDDVPPAHQPCESLRALPGRITLWPLAPRASATMAIPWELPAPVQAWASSQTLTAVQRCAEGIVALLDSWRKNPPFLSTQNRPLELGDVLVLVRKRSAFIGQFKEAAQHYGLNVRGLEAGYLQDMPGLQDLIYLGRWAMLGQDDFITACILKGPWGGLRDSDLEMLIPAERRCRRSLWRCFCAYAKTHQPLWVAIVERLEDLREKARLLSAKEFYMWLLAQGGYDLLLAHFGATIVENVEVWEETLSSYDKLHPAGSMEEFIFWLDTLRPRVPERAQGIQKNTVRLMTVHGAKGLQAPVVILAETTWGPLGGSWFEKVQDPEGQASLQFIPARTKSVRLKQLRGESQKREQEENLRLLYVALTRAQEQIHIMGWEMSSGNSVTWHQQMREIALQLGQAQQLVVPGPYGWSGEGVVVHDA